MTALPTRTVLVLTAIAAIVVLQALSAPPPPVAANAAPEARRVSALALVQAADILVPAEWQGIWESAETTYDCAGGPPTGQTASVDTICAGDTVSISDPSINCSGFADATTIDVTCTAVSFDEITGCTTTLVFRTFGTRTGDTADIVTIESISVTGCIVPLEQCDSTVVQSTRTGPPPPGYCASPVGGVTWGELKQIYE